MYERESLIKIFRVRERKERRLLVVEIARVAVVTRRPGTVSLLT